jgi:hypothetical protein
VPVFVFQNGLVHVMLICDTGVWKGSSESESPRFVDAGLLVALYLNIVDGFLVLNLPRPVKKN